MECPICFEKYTTNASSLNTIPMILTSCGHTICAACVSNIKSLKCPFDNLLFERAKIFKNYALMDIIDSNDVKPSYLNASMASVLCSECSLESVSKYCVHCKRSFCTECCRIIHSIVAKRTHEIVAHANTTSATGNNTSDEMSSCVAEVLSSNQFQYDSQSRGNFVLLSGGSQMISPFTMSSGMDDKTLRTTLIYDIKANRFKMGPHMNFAREAHASVTLSDCRRIFICGGCNFMGMLSSCELFDSIQNEVNSSISVTANMSMKRNNHSAALIMTHTSKQEIGSNQVQVTDRVLVVGGHNGLKELNSTEIYDVSRDIFTHGPDLIVARSSPTSVTLPDGKVLVCAGYNGKHILKSTELYDPLKNTFTLGPDMIEKRAQHSIAASWTANNSVKMLISGGENGCVSNSTELFDPTSNAFSRGPDMLFPRRLHTSSSLSDGRILISGGFDGTQRLDSTEIYNPQTNTFSRGPDMPKSNSCYLASLFHC